MRLRDFPLVIKYEKYAQPLLVARKERRYEDVERLKAERAALRYTPPTRFTAAKMRSRLDDLSRQLEARFNDLSELEDDNGCVVCSAYIEKVQFLIECSEERQ